MLFYENGQTKNVISDYKGAGAAAEITPTSFFVLRLSLVHINQTYLIFYILQSLLSVHNSSPHLSPQWHRSPVEYRRGHQSWKEDLKKGDRLIRKAGNTASFYSICCTESTTFSYPKHNSIKMLHFRSRKLLGSLTRFASCFGHNEVIKTVMLNETNR